MAGNDFIAVKHCRTCGIEKPHSEFYKAACCKDGLRGECKACVAPKQPAPAADQGADLGDVQANTSPAFPPVPQQVEQGMTGIETPTTADNLEGVA